jgi:predicted membrane protein
MNLNEIWEVAGPLVVTAIVLLTIGLLVLTMSRKMNSSGLRKFVKAVSLLAIVVPILFLLYTILRAIIFLFFF